MFLILFHRFLLTTLTAFKSFFPSNIHQVLETIGIGLKPLPNYIIFIPLNIASFGSLHFATKNAFFLVSIGYFFISNRQP